VKTRTLWTLVLGVAAAGSTSVVARADGPRDDEVDLVDGSTLHGKITGQTPGSFVVIQTSDGRVESIPWSQVKRVSASAAPAALPPTPASPPVAAAPVAVPSVAAPPAAAPPSVPPPQEAPPGAQTTLREVHFEVGARLGYSVASGDYYSGSQITSASTAAGPGINSGATISLDLGLRMSRYFYVGGFFSYSLLSTSCLQAPADSTLSCDAHDIRGGIDAVVHVFPRGTIDPWVGLGLGHEWLTVSVAESSSTASAKASQTFDGWNYGHLLLGVDFHTSRAVGLGPFLELTSGSFASASVSATGTSGGSTSSTSQSGDIASTSSHQWISVGVRGTYEVL
jgi:hypothetical protein